MWLFFLAPRFVCSPRSKCLSQTLVTYSFQPAQHLTILSPQAHSCFKPPSPRASPDGHCSLPAKSMHMPSLCSSHQTNNSRSLGVTSELRTRRQHLASGSWPGVLLLNPNISQNINTRQGQSARDRSRQTRPLHNHEQELYPKHKNVQTSPTVDDGVTAASLESQL